MFDAWSDVEIWALFALLLWLAEVFVPGMILGCLGTGALGGLLAAALGAGLELQLIAASVAAVAAFVFLRPLAMNKWFQGANVATGVEALVGRTGRVTQPFDAHTQLGRCQVDGDDWLAKWAGPSPSLPAIGDSVYILRSESNTLIVTNTPPSA